MTVVSALSPISLTQFFYQSGKIVRPARLFFYKPGTEDPVTVYTDPALGVPYDHPVLSGGSGRVPPIYVGTEPYRVRVFDSFGSLIEDIDYLPGATDSGGGGGGGGDTSGASLLPGDYIIAFTSGGPRAGCVRANGGVIGPTGSPYGAGNIERLNNDTEVLFKHLWGQDITSGVIPVLPSRGASSDADWLAGKALTLPDLRGRALRGIDGLGLAPKGRLTNVGITGSQIAPGSFGGVAITTITQLQMPVHSHTVSAAFTGITVTQANATGITVPGSQAALNPGATANYTQLTFGATPGAFANINDPPHAHYITDLGHTHPLGTAGGNEGTQTVGPFSLATIYIKM